jgi:predicted nucleic acid-binding protein
MIEQTSVPIVYLDAMTFIFAIEGKPAVSDPMITLFKSLQNSPGAAVTSELTLAEILAGWEILQNPSIRRAYLDLIIWGRFIELVPVSREILVRSADLRFIHSSSHGKKLKLPDAIHLATASDRQCRYFMTADKDIRMPVDMERVAPDEAGVAQVQKALQSC